MQCVSVCGGVGVCVAADSEISTLLRAHSVDRSVWKGEVKDSAVEKWMNGGISEAGGKKNLSPL